MPVTLLKYSSAVLQLMTMLVKLLFV